MVMSRQRPHTACLLHGLRVPPVCRRGVRDGRIHWRRARATQPVGWVIVGLGRDTGGGLGGGGAGRGVEGAGGADGGAVARVQVAGVVQGGVYGVQEIHELPGGRLVCVAALLSLKCGCKEMRRLQRSVDSH